MEPAERSFRTKTGRCVVHDDRLEIERGGARGALASVLFATPGRAQAVYSVLVIVLLTLAAIAFLERDTVQGTLFLLAAAWLARGIVRSRGLSAAPVLVRSEITRIQARAPSPPFTRGHFIVHFTQQGQALRRLVILPGTLEGGSAEYTRALELLRREGLPVQ